VQSETEHEGDVGGGDVLESDRRRLQPRPRKSAEIAWNPSRRTERARETGSSAAMRLGIRTVRIGSPERSTNAILVIAPSALGSRLSNRSVSSRNSGSHRSS
jgi:hypothetical protein